MAYNVTCNRQGTKRVRRISIYIYIYHSVLSYTYLLKKWSHRIVPQSTNIVGSGACGLGFRGVQSERKRHVTMFPP